MGWERGWPLNYMKNLQLSHLLRGPRRGQRAEEELGTQEAGRLRAGNKQEKQRMKVAEAASRLDGDVAWPPFILSVLPPTRASEHGQPPPLSSSPDILCCFLEDEMLDEWWGSLWSQRSVGPPVWGPWGLGGPLLGLRGRERYRLSCAQVCESSCCFQWAFSTLLPSMEIGNLKSLF